LRCLNKDKDKNKDDEVIKTTLYKNTEYLAVSILLAVSAVFLFMTLNESTNIPNTPLEILDEDPNQDPNND